MGVATDLALFCSLNMPEADTGTSGGAIDLDNRPVFSVMSANASLRVKSSAAGDTTQQITVEGRDADGDIVTDTKTLNGTNNVSLSSLGTVTEVLKATLNADAAGIVTLETDAAVVIGTIPIGERGFMAVHRKALASAVAARDFYYKVFAKNIHATHTLNGAQVVLFSDPFDRATFALAAATNDSGSVANRLTSPGLTFNDTDKAVPGGDLTAAEAIGIWLKFSHPAGDNSYMSSITLRVKGTSFA